MFKRYLSNFSIIIAICMLFCMSGYGQIISPDTVCVNTPINFNSTDVGVSNSWVFSPFSIVQTPSTLSTIASGSPLSVCAFTSIVCDNGHYYGFMTNAGTNSITKMDFGTNPTSSPTLTDMGTFGMTAGLNEGIDVVLDTLANTWYALIVNGSDMVRLNFGSSLSSTPTSTLMSFPSNLFYPLQITIKKYNGNWIAFTADHSGGLTRFDFGTSLSSAPTPVSLPSSGGINNPCYFALYEQAGNWYMLVLNLIDADITRMSFGTNLQSNTPAGTFVGNPGGLMNLPRGISLLPNCNGQLIAYMINESGELIRLDFAGDITNMPVATDLGPTGVSSLNCLTPFTYQNTLYYYPVSFTLNTSYRFSVATYPSVDTTEYYRSTYNHTFTTAGVYPVTLLCNEGYQAGPSVYCKDIVVTDGTVVTASRDTSICTGSTLVLTAGGAGPATWSTGSTATAIVVADSGTYWVRTVTGPCSFHVDTVHVHYNLFNTGLPASASLCAGDSVMLHATEVTGAAYTWSTGSTDSIITVHTAGVYWLHVSDICGIQTDSVHVTNVPDPLVNLGPDTTSCSGSEVELQSSAAYISPTYLWSNGSTTPTIMAVTSGTFWLKVIDNGCWAADTIVVTIKYDTLHIYTPDTAICKGDSMMIRAGGNPGAAFEWVPTEGVSDTTALNTMVKPDTAIKYHLLAYLPGCPVAEDSITIHLQAPAATAYTLQDVCLGDTVSLALTAHNADAATFTWLADGVDMAGSPSVSVATASSNSGGPFMISWNIPGMHIITLYAVSPIGCRSAPVYDTVHVHAPPDATFTYKGRDGGLCIEDSVLFTASDSNYNDRYYWTPIHFFDNNNSHTIWGRVEEAVSNVTLTVTDAYGCTASSKLELDPGTCCTVTFPQAFSPNADGHNDVFRPISAGYHRFHNMRIANRWGQIVFESTNSIMEWDGTFEGVPQELGVYYYFLTYDCGGETIKQQGDVTLIR